MLHCSRSECEMLKLVDTRMDATLHRIFADMLAPVSGCSLQSPHFTVRPGARFGAESTRVVDVKRG